MLTTIDQFAGQDIWVYAELDYEDAYIRIEKVFDSGTVIYNAWLPSDSLDKYDLDEILYGELTGDVDSIEIHPLDTLTTEELIAKIEAANGITSSKQFTKYPQGYVKASKSSRKYTAFYNGEIFDVSSDCDDLIKQLKAEIDEAIAEGDVENIDFGECWVEDEDEEVMYIADGDSDYAEYL